MRKKSILLIFSILTFILLPIMGDDLRVAFMLKNGSRHAIPVDSIDSLTFPQDGSAVNIALVSGDTVVLKSIEEMYFDSCCSDTLLINFTNAGAIFYNPHPHKITLESDSTSNGISVKTKNLQNLVISITGEGTGRLKVESDSDYTLVLNDIKLTSRNAPCINSVGKGHMQLVLGDSTENVLSDDSVYVFSDTLESANGCLNSKGHIDICGNGKLTVSGNRKHAIFSKKGIRIMGGEIEVVKSVSDGIHSGKYVSIEGGNTTLHNVGQDAIDTDEYFQQTAGSLTFTISSEGKKGIKTIQSILVTGGKLNGTSTSGTLKEDNDITFSSLMKCDSIISLLGGEITLNQKGDGGRCITADKELIINDAKIILETSGKGDKYISKTGKQKYYTARCVTTEGDFTMTSGELTCLSTGIGGKGINVEEQAIIGTRDTTLGFKAPVIRIETKGDCIVNDVENDFRDGCPKAFKVGDTFIINDCDMQIHTDCMGGEGLECLSSLYIYGGTIECNTFDDGINVESTMDVCGGNIYCFSSDNDGIDSNGRMTVIGGTIVAQSGHPDNESFDTDRGRFYILGGNMFGLSPSRVKVELAEQPYYGTPVIQKLEDGTRLSGISATKGKYYYLTHQDSVIAALRCEFDSDHAFFFLSQECMQEGETYTIYEGDAPATENVEALFDGKYYRNCELPMERIMINTIQVKK